jgi:hypothetical protein
MFLKKKTVEVQSQYKFGQVVECIVKVGDTDRRYVKIKVVQPNDGWFYGIEVDTNHWVKDYPISVYNTDVCKIVSEGEDINE